MKKSDTKERILSESLKLFSRKGYAAVGVAEIADAVGIKTPSLYKHYRNKQAIFDSILKRMRDMDSEQAKDYQMPEETMLMDAESYKVVSIEQICSYTKAMFLYWTQNEFSNNFRKLLTLEQYKSADMGRLYQQYLSDGPVNYMADIFLEFAASETEARQLSLEFYGPMYLLYSLYDSTSNKELVVSLLEKHLTVFSDRLSKKLTEKEKLL